MNSKCIIKHHRLAITLRPLTGEMKNIDDLVTMSWGGVYQAASEQTALEFGVLEAGNMSKDKDLSDGHRSQIVTARQPSQNVSKTAGLE